VLSFQIEIPTHTLIILYIPAKFQTITSKLRVQITTTTITAAATAIKNLEIDGGTIIRRILQN
jgi:hypothetical protein